MIKKIKNYLLLLAAPLMLTASAAVPAVASAATTTDPSCNAISSQVANGANTAATGTADPNQQPASSQINCNNVGDGTGATIGKAANSIVNIFSIIVGAVAVIMIIYGGFRYITSGGDSGKVGSAKNSLIYAIIGLVIVALAQVIVHFVLNQSAAISQ